MNTINLLILVHVLSAFILFSAWVSEFIVLTFRGLNSVISDENRSAQKRLSVIQMTSMILVVISGMWLMNLRWGPQLWLVTSVVALGIMIVYSLFMSVRIRKIRKLPEPNAKTIARLSGISILFRISGAVGIVVLMALKPMELSTILAIFTFVIAVFLTGIYLRYYRF